MGRHYFGDIEEANLPLLFNLATQQTGLELLASKTPSHIILALIISTILRKS